MFTYFWTNLPLNKFNNRNFNVNLNYLRSLQMLSCCSYRVYYIYIFLFTWWRKCLLLPGSQLKLEFWSFYEYSLEQIVPRDDVWVTCTNFFPSKLTDRQVFKACDLNTLSQLHKCYSTLGCFSGEFRSYRIFANSSTIHC